MKHFITWRIIPSQTISFTSKLISLLKCTCHSGSHIVLEGTINNANPKHFFLYCKVCCQLESHQFPKSREGNFYAKYRSQESPLHPAIVKGKHQVRVAPAWWAAGKETQSTACTFQHWGPPRDMRNCWIFQ